MCECNPLYTGERCDIPKSDLELPMAFAIEETTTSTPTIATSTIIGSVCGLLAVVVVVVFVVLGFYRRNLKFRQTVQQNCSCFFRKTTSDDKARRQNAVDENLEEAEIESLHTHTS